MQIESGMAMRSLQPQIKAVQERYAGDQVTTLLFDIIVFSVIERNKLRLFLSVMQERIQLETARLYKLAGINPLAGMMPFHASFNVVLEG